MANESTQGFKGYAWGASMIEVTVHCVACRSQNIVEINGVNKWDIDQQDWVSTDSPAGYMYECYDCGEQSEEFETKEWHVAPRGEVKP